MLNNQPCNQNSSQKRPESSMNDLSQKRPESSMNYSSSSLQQTEVKNQLNDQHWQNTTKERGLDPSWVKANCYSADIKQVSEILHYKAKSGGIVIDTPTQVQVRPDKPWRSEKGKKAPKYRTPLKDDYDAILPTNPDDPSYWTDIEKLKQQAYNIDGVPCLLVTEGGFKAIAGCSNGLPTIGLCGVEQGLTGSKHDPEEKRYLVPSLRYYADHGFGFIIPFDADCATNKKVIEAEKKLAFQLEKMGVPVYSITGTWSEEEGKGMDDFIQANGVEAFREKLAQAEKVSEKYKKDKEDEEKQKPPKASDIADDLADKYHGQWIYCEELSSWLVYGVEKTGVWKAISKDYLSHLIFVELEARGLNSFFTTNLLTNIITYLKAKLMIVKWEEPSHHYLPFNNGVYELATGKLHNHSPEFRLTWKLERDYSAIALDCDTILNFLARLANGNQKSFKLLLYYLAATLRGRHDLQKFLYLIGTGGTGKSTYLNLAQMLVGEKNTSTQALEELEDKHNIMDLFGKRLLALPDQAPIGKRNNGNFKRLTGGDYLSGRLLYKNTASFQFKGMSILTSNSFVFPGSAQNWLTRRMILVECNQIIPQHERASGIEKKMEAELEAFTNYLLAIPEEDIEKVLKGIDQPDEVNQSSWDYFCQSDGIAAWVNDHLIQDKEAFSVIGSDKNKWKLEDYDPDVSSLYASYCHYCRETGRTPKTTQTFSHDLLELVKNVLGWSAEKVQKKLGGKTMKVIKGLRLRTEQDDEIPLVEDLLGIHRNRQYPPVSTEVTTPKPAPQEEVSTGIHSNQGTAIEQNATAVAVASPTEKSNEAVVVKSNKGETSEIRGYGGYHKPELPTDKDLKVDTPNKDRVDTGGDGGYHEPDFSSYPSRNSDDYRHKEKRATKCKEQMLECQTKQQLDTFKSEGGFSVSEIKWVWNNLMSKQEQGKVKAISNTEQPELLSNEKPEHHRWVPLEAKPYGTENDLPQDEIQKLVIEQLFKNGEMEEYHLIVAVGQKSPAVRQALEEVAVSRNGKYNDVPTKFWKLKG